MTPENGHKLEVAEAPEVPEARDGPDVAVYIASLADELSRLAKRHDLDALAYILDMARLEADQISKRWVPKVPGGSRGSG